MFFPGKSHGWRSLVGCSPWDREELDTTEQLHSHSSLSCIGEGYGNQPQCSCLENPRDGGAWWAAIYGVTQSQTWLKWLTSSSSRYIKGTSLLRKVNLDYIEILTRNCNRWMSHYLESKRAWAVSRSIDLLHKVGSMDQQHSFLFKMQNLRPYPSSTINQNLYF